MRCSAPSRCGALIHQRRILQVLVGAPRDGVEQDELARPATVPPLRNEVVLVQQPTFAQRRRVRCAAGRVGEAIGVEELS